MVRLMAFWRWVVLHRGGFLGSPGPWTSGLPHLRFLVCVYVWVLAAQVCRTLGQPMDCSLPGSSVRGVFQARY